MRKPVHRVLVVILIAACCAKTEWSKAGTVALQIGPQPLPSALRQFAQQSGLQVLFPAGDVGESMLVEPIAGEVRPDVALSQLLARSGLAFKFVNAQTIAIYEASALTGTEDEDEASTSVGGGRPRGPREEAEKGIPEVLVKGARSLNADIERTQDDIQPYVVLDKKMIERSGATNLDDLLRSRLTMNYVQRPSDQGIPAAGGGSTSLVALRGLSASQTLILIDGRRAGARTFFGEELQPDLNSIPLGSIERIEVLPATASGIYGGGATGGVVNVVLRRDYSGLETTVRYENGFDGGGQQRRIDLNSGIALNGGRTSVHFTGGLSDTDELRAGKRSFYEDYSRRRDSNRQIYDPTYFTSGSPILGATTNISSVPTLTPVPAGTPGAIGPIGGRFFANIAPNLVLKPQYGGFSLGSPITYVPDGYRGAASDAAAGLLQHAGTYNLALADTQQSGARDASLQNGPTTQSLSATVQHSFSERVDAFLTISGAKNDAHFTQNNVSGVFTVNSTAPNNPFRQNVRVNVPIALADGSESVVNHRSARVLTGVKIALAHDWSTAFEYSFDRSDLKQTFPSAVLSPQAAAAVSTGAFDVLTAPPLGGFDLSRYGLQGNNTFPSHTILKDASARVAGPVGYLPAGPLVLTTLLEHRKQLFSEFSQTFVNSSGTLSTSTYSPQASSVNSAYLEAQIPVVSDKMEFRAVRGIDLQIAARFDSYRNSGGVDSSAQINPTGVSESKFSSLDPTFGVRVRPFEHVMLRASYGTGFLPPSLNSIIQPPPQLVSNVTLRDPKRANELVGNYLLGRAGEFELRPEESISKSVGVVLTPFRESLRLSFDWTRVSKRDNITSLRAEQANINLEDLLSSFVVRNTDPSTFGAFGVGPIVGLNTGLVNATRAYSESYDVALSYSLETDKIGRFDLYSRGTRMVHDEEQILPVRPSTEQVGTIFSPSWQANASLTWTRRSLGATWSTRYFGANWLQADRAFSAGQGSARVDSETYHDAALSYHFEGGQGSLVPGGDAILGVKNVFNTKPRFLGYSPLLYDAQTSPMLATYYVSFTARF